VREGWWQRGRTHDRRQAESSLCRVAEGFAKKNALIFQLANGKLNQGPKWTLSCYYVGSSVKYTFSHGIDAPIKGKRNFEAYLLKNYKPEMLTEEGKSARAALQEKADRAAKTKQRKLG
jgi:hypothetical protein